MSDSDSHDSQETAKKPLPFVDVSELYRGSPLLTFFTTNPLFNANFSLPKCPPIPAFHYTNDLPEDVMFSEDVLDAPLSTPPSQADILLHRTVTTVKSGENKPRETGSADYHLICGDTRLGPAETSSQPVEGLDRLVVELAERNSSTEQTLKEMVEFNMRVHGIAKLPLANIDTSSPSPLRPLLLLQTAFTRSALKQYSQPDYLADFGFIEVAIPTTPSSTRSLCSTDVSSLQRILVDTSAPIVKRLSKKFGWRTGPQAKEAKDVDTDVERKTKEAGGNNIDLERAYAERKKDINKKQSDVHKRRFAKIWEQKIHWEAPPTHQDNQGGRTKTISLGELERHAVEAVGELDRWLTKAMPSLHPIGSNMVKSEVRDRSRVTQWNTTMLPVAHVRVNNFLSVMSDTVMGDLPGDILEQVRWCSFLTVLPAITTIDPCTFMVLLQATLQHIRRLGMQAGCYSGRFHQGLLDIEATLNGAMMAALRCFRKIPKSVNQFGTAQAIYRSLLNEASHKGSTSPFNVVCLLDRKISSCSSALGVRMPLIVSIVEKRWGANMNSIWGMFTVTFSQAAAMAYCTWHIGKSTSSCLTGQRY